MFLHIIWILKENAYKDIADKFSEGLRQQIKLEEGKLQRVKNDLKGRKVWGPNMGHLRT